MKNEGKGLDTCYSAAKFCQWSAATISFHRAQVLPVSYRTVFNKNTVWVKKDQRYFSLITLPNVGRFLTFFHRWIQQEICNKIIVIISATP